MLKTHLRRDDTECAQMPQIALLTWTVSGSGTTCVVCHQQRLRFFTLYPHKGQVTASRDALQFLSERSIHFEMRLDVGRGFRPEIVARLGELAQLGVCASIGFDVDEGDLKPMEKFDHAAPLQLLPKREETINVDAWT
ncbi:hypothetical protein [Paracoccus aestuariivivens]|uniref:Uncharacterized protein n=1 Tax=Paracoccus aestuariivivens TaxID=1820333 RepID=A0A6L6JFY7_9RHOB|nr:hypothetical protein [Paracoccus aestuariivivens]MTH80195.1 hypothetical protein [Paracoccus aestuariivivens]